MHIFLSRLWRWSFCQWHILLLLGEATLAEEAAVDSEKAAQALAAQDLSRMRPALTVALAVKVVVVVEVVVVAMVLLVGLSVRMIMTVMVVAVAAGEGRWLRL